MFDRREFTVLLGAALAWPNSVVAQVLARAPLVAMLVAGSAKGYSRHVQAFRRGLEELGYAEGRNLEIIYRYSDGDPARLPALAEELVKLKPDVIVTTNTSAALAAKQATTIIPIVSTTLTDPIGNGLAASQAHPGANVTGIEFTIAGLTGKQLELAREVVPHTSTVGVLVHMKSASNPPQRRDAEAAAKTLGIRLVAIDVEAPEQLRTAFDTFVSEQVDWVLVLADALFTNERTRIAQIAISLRLPTIYPLRELVEAGGLISYGVDMVASHKRRHTMLTKFSRGATLGIYRSSSQQRSQSPST